MDAARDKYVWGLGKLGFYRICATKPLCVIVENLPMPISSDLNHSATSHFSLQALHRQRQFWQ